MPDMIGITLKELQSREDDVVVVVVVVVVFDVRFADHKFHACMGVYKHFSPYVEPTENVVLQF
jgi:hypothetical protein